MKNLLKLGLVASFAFLMIFTTGCGKEDKKLNNDNKPSQSEKKKDNKSGNDWKDIDESNCMSIIKNKTGIDLSKLGSVNITNAYGASTGVAEVTGKYESDTTKVSIFEGFIKELLRVNNSIWSTTVNNETYRIEKVKEYTDYESFFEWKKNGNEDLANNLSGSLYIENYSVTYTFTNSQFNVHVASYVIK